MQRGSLAIISRKKGLLSGNFGGPRKICMGLGSNGRECLGRLSAIQAKPLPVLLSPFSWRRSMRTK